MAKFTKISRKDAPDPIRQSGRLKSRMREYDNYVSALKKGEAGRLDLEGNETGRGVALRISRAAKRVNTPIKTWVVDRAVYFELEGR